MSDILDTLRQEGVDPALLTAVQEYRAAHPLSEALRPRIPAPAFTYYGKEVWEQALAAILCGENLLLAGGKATGKMPAGNYAVYNLTVSGNTITTTGGGITGTDLQNCTLADNRITHTGAAAETTVGILLHGSSGNLIEKNTCTALHNGLKCMDASHSNELRSNTVTNSRSSAVCIVDSNGVEVTENTIRTGATNGIFVQRSKSAPAAQYHSGNGS